MNKGEHVQYIAFKDSTFFVWPAPVWSSTGRARGIHPPKQSFCGGRISLFGGTRRSAHACARGSGGCPFRIHLQAKTVAFGENGQKNENFSFFSYHCVDDTNI